MFIKTEDFFVHIMTKNDRCGIITSRIIYEVCNKSIIVISLTCDAVFIG